MGFARDRAIAEELTGVSTPVTLAVNKIDQLTEEQTNQVVQGAKALGPWPVFAISALEQNQPRPISGLLGYPAARGTPVLSRRLYH